LPIANFKRKTPKTQLQKSAQIRLIRVISGMGLVFGVVLFWLKAKSYQLEAPLISGMVLRLGVASVWLIANC
jgi:hypothetical protein